MASSLGSIVKVQSFTQTFFYYSTLKYTFFRRLKGSVHFELRVDILIGTEGQSFDWARKIIMLPIPAAKIIFL